MFHVQTYGAPAVLHVDMSIMMHFNVGTTSRHRDLSTLKFK